MTAATAHTPRRRRRRTIVLIFVLVVLLTTAAAVTWSVIAADDGSKSARIDEDGFSMSVADARISAPGGVAAEGTVINAESTPVDVSEVAWGSATALRDGLSITLEDGAQPQQPVQLQFTIPDDVQIPDDSVVFVLADSPDMEKPELLETQWDPETRTATATTDHFTDFVPVLIEAGKAAAGIAVALHRIITLQTNQPSCYGKDPLEGEASITVSKISRNPVWPCLSLDGGKLTVDLQSKSALIWKLTSIPDPDAAAPNPTTGAGLLVARAHTDGRNDENESLVLPNETASIDYSVSDLPIEMRLDAAPGLMVLNVTGMASSEILPDDWAALVAAAECTNDFSELIDDDTAYDDIYLTALTCIGSAVGGPPGAILSLIANAPGALYGSFYGIISTFAGESDKELTIQLDVPAEARAVAPGQMHLFEVERRNGGRSGEETDSWVQENGAAKLYPSSTTQWVGCNGTVAETTYRLDGGYSRLTTTAALREGTPEGMRASFEFILDDVSAHVATVTAGTTGQAVDLDLADAEELTIRADTSDECTADSLAYGALLNATVTEKVAMPLGDTADLVGTWAGEYTQPRTSLSDGTEMTLELLPDGDSLSGKVSYPQIKCGGTWHEKSRTDTSIVFSEEVTENETGRCVDVEEVKLERTPDGIQAAYRFRTLTGTASLTKE